MGRFIRGFLLPLLLVSASLLNWSLIGLVNLIASLTLLFNPQRTDFCHQRRFLLVWSSGIFSLLFALFQAAFLILYAINGGKWSIAVVWWVQLIGMMGLESGRNPSAICFLVLQLLVGFILLADAHGNRFMLIPWRSSFWGTCLSVIRQLVNGWDEEGNNGEEYVVVIALNILSIEHGIERIDLLHESMEMVKINLGNGTVTRQPLSAKNLEYGVVNPAYKAKKSRYVYAGVLSDKGPPGVRGIVKLDVAMAERDDTVADCTTASRMYGPGCYGGPISFVACEPKDLNAAEDDGYLVSYIHDEIKGESGFIVMDTKSTSLDIVASVKLPQRVPYGFHGLFIRDDDLDLHKI